MAKAVGRPREVTLQWILGRPMGIIQHNTFIRRMKLIEPRPGEGDRRGDKTFIPFIP